MSFSLPQPLIQVSVLRSLVFTTRFDWNTNQWESFHLYMCTRMGMICKAFLERHASLSPEGQVKFLDSMATELVSLPSHLLSVAHP